jgi:hypothetical protein
MLAARKRAGATTETQRGGKNGADVEGLKERWHEDWLREGVIDD